MSHNTITYPQTPTELTLSGVLNSTPQDQSLVMRQGGAWAAHKPSGEAIALSVRRPSFDTIPAINGLPTGNSIYNVYRPQNYSANDGTHYTFFRQTGLDVNSQYAEAGEADGYSPLYKRSSYAGNGIFSNNIKIKTTGTWLLTASLAFGTPSSTISYIQVLALYSSVQGQLSTPNFYKAAGAGSRNSLYIAVFDTTQADEIITLRITINTSNTMYASTRTSILGESITLSKIG